MLYLKYTLYMYIIINAVLLHVGLSITHAFFGVNLKKIKPQKWTKPFFFFFAILAIYSSTRSLQLFRFQSLMEGTNRHTNKQTDRQTSRLID